MKTLVLSNAETEAVLHVRDIQATGHQHSVRGCPPFSRAMCRHQDSLRRASEKFDRADRILTSDGYHVFKGVNGQFHVSEGKPADVAR